MNYQQLIDFRNKTSPTVCLAKFHEATIWLYFSKIAGCHHTPLYTTGNTIETFFNTDGKRMQQESMMKGEKPMDCNYCWNLESKGQTSDRQHKSLHFKSHLEPETYFDKSYNFKPKALELAFQNTCNLACSYCSPSFSTEWINDIKKNGMYQNINTDIKRHYERGLDNNIPVDLNLFWTWFDSISSDLESIRITGGEPLLHEETFETFKKILTVNKDIECVIHTNLCQKPLVIQRFIDSVNTLTNVRINISNESSGEIAEFIRDGMIYSEWLENVAKLSRETKATLSISTTITSLSLIGLDQLYRDIIKLRKDNNVTNPYISVNFATYPVFQSVQNLSMEERQFYLTKYQNLLDEIKHDLLDIELQAYQRILSMLNPDETNTEHNQLRMDFDNFFQQYIKRRNKTNDITKLLGKQ